MTIPIFTVGYSNHPIEIFLSILRRCQINVIADVRSQPQSQFNPDFGKDLIEKHLASASIKYRFLGAELGARSRDEDCYDGGRVVYSRLAQKADFQQALDKLMLGGQKLRIALMCAEGDPLACHRTILVSRYLYKRGCSISHILPNGSLEPHDQTMLRLVQRLGLYEQANFFLSDEQKLDMAYEIQEKKIAYQRSQDLEAIA